MTKELHYSVICISTYNDDLARWDDLVAKLKARGVSKASRSALIRFAMDRFELSEVPDDLGAPRT